MTAASVGTGAAILALAGLAVGVVVLGAVVALFHRVMTPAREIRRYADDILEAGLAIAGNVEGAGELRRTHELAGAVPGLATEYLRRREAA